MEDIEYLEGYEDLVLPEVNSCAGSFANNSSVNTDVTIKGTITEKANYDEYDSDASSSSIDPEIFNYFFDVHSDDDPLPENKLEHILNQKEDSMDSTDNLVKDLVAGCKSMTSRKSSNTSSACPRSGVSANTKPTSSTTLTAMQLNLGSFKKTKIQIKPPATIVRPEKIINNDPEEDPLSKCKPCFLVLSSII
uniref:Uncharacterized protein n=1 Tax=Glossina brevipalpis TaxID=37001 RepID=A0A1A9W3R6_9MUSC